MSQPSSLLALPRDVQQIICQHLFVVSTLGRKLEQALHTESIPYEMQAADLHSLEVCSRGCHQMVNRPALWQSLLVQRFGQLTADRLFQTTTYLSVLDLKQQYVQLSRQIIPAPKMQVLPKRQLCIWRFSR